MVFLAVVNLDTDYFLRGSYLADGGGILVGVYRYDLQLGCCIFGSLVVVLQLSMTKVNVMRSTWLNSVIFRF